MALIECAESLSSSTKAKLQDVGILYTADVAALVNGDWHCPFSAPITAVRAELQRRIARCLSAPAPNLLRQTTAATATTAPVCLSSHDQAASSFPPSPDPHGPNFPFTDREVEEIVEVARGAPANNTTDAVHSQEARAKMVHRSTATFQTNTSMPPNTLSDERQNKNTQATSAFNAAAHILGCRTLHDIMDEAATRQAQGQPTHATTFSRQLDALFGGGVPLGDVTEISGPPGVGKTQLLMQLAVSAAMPVEFGGLGGACLFVDTEGSFVVERLEQMATAAVTLVQSILVKQRATEGTLPLHQNTGSEAGNGNTAGRGTRKRDRSTSAVAAHRQYLPNASAALRQDVDTANIQPIAETTVHDTEGGAKESEEPTGWEQRAQCTSRGREDDAQGLRLDDFTVESVLQRVHYVRVTDLVDLMAFLYGLPAWIHDQTTPRHSADATGGDTATSTAERQGTVPVRMVLIDSIALPFRSSESFHKTLNGSDASVTSTSSRFNSGPTNLFANAPGTLSKQGLWQRSRLLFQCSTLLEEVASEHQLCVLVSNHMTTKTLRGLPSSPPGTLSTPLSPNDDGCTNAARYTVLVPALGDAWGTGLSTRLLLAFRHYELPSCAFVSTTSMARTSSNGNADQCLEDVVYQTTSSAAALSSSTPARASVRVMQHRVARLLKASGQPRGETCFLITSKGVRDAQKDMIAQHVTPRQS